MKKELKSGILSADKSAECRPTVGGAIVIAVLAAASKKCSSAVQQITAQSIFYSVLRERELANRK